MANIKPYTDAIQTAVYGEQVRSSIIDALTKVNDDNNSYIDIKNDIIDAKDDVDEKYASFNTVYEEAKTTKSQLQTTINNANTAKSQLNTTTTNANTAKSQLQTTINNANTAKTQLESSASAAVSDVNSAITRANTAKTNLDNSNITAAATNQNLQASITSATSAKTALDGSVSTANVSKADLDSTITAANTTKGQVIQEIDSKTTQSISEVNAAKNELAMVVGSVPSVATTTNNELTAKCTRSGIEIMHIKGKTEQPSGKPVPNSEYPLSLNSVKFDKIVVMGKNFGVFPNVGLSSARVSRYKQLCDGTISLTATGEDAYIGGVEGKGISYDPAKGKLIPIPEGATDVYVNGFNGPFNGMYITFYDRNKLSLGYSNISYRLSIPSDAQYLSYRCGVSNSISGKTYEGKVVLSFSPIEITDWEPPYYEEIKLLQPIVLRSCATGEYDEYLGDEKILRRCKEYVVNPETVNVHQQTTSGLFCFNTPFISDLKGLNQEGRMNVFCNRSSAYDTNTENSAFIYTTADLSNQLFAFLPSSIKTIQEGQNYLANNEYRFIYPLAEPYIETIDMPILPSTDSECTAFLINSQAYTGGMYENLPVETDVTWRPCPLSDPIRKVIENESSIDAMMQFQKTGKLYQTVIPKFAQSNSTSCVKTLDNEGMNASPSTDTTAGTDDYIASGELLFQWRNCNYVRESDGFAVPTAFEGEPDYATSGAVDVGVFFPTFYYSYLEKDDGYYLTVSDTPNDEWQLKPAEPAVRQDGTVMPYFILSKYPSVIASDGKLRSQPGLAVDRFHSYQNMVTKYGAKGEGYRGAGAFRWTMQYIWILIKYAQKSGQNVFSGCTNSNYQYPAATQSSEAHDYIVVTSAQAGNINLGDCVIVGYPTSLSNGSANLDRSVSSMYALVNSKRVTSKETLSDGKVAIHIAGASFTTQDRAAIGSNNVAAHVYITSMGRFTGETDQVKGRFDGSYISNASGKYGFRIQGIEYADGVYNIPSDVIMIKKSDFTIDVYKCKSWDARKNSESDVTAFFTKVGTIPKAPDTSGYGDWWIGDAMISGHVLFPFKAGSSDSTGTGDRFYHGGNSTGTREAPEGGYIRNDSSAGPCSVSGGTGPSGASWYFASAD